MVNNEDPAVALLALCTTPGKDKTTPAQKLMGHTLKTNLLTINQAFPQNPQQCRKQPLLITMLLLKTYLYFTLATTEMAETG